MDYPSKAPFHPNSRYEEYPFSDDIDTDNNVVYSAIRTIFDELGFDRDHMGTAGWNPMGGYVKQEQTVLLKPNMVNHINPAEKDPVKGMACLITHPSIVRCIFDYVYIALKGKGHIIIADAPVQGCNFDELLKNSGYGELFKYLKTKETEHLKISIADLREVTYIKEDSGVIIQKERENMEFPGILVDLGKKSYFGDLNNKKNLRITCYDAKDTIEHHTREHNEYKISSAVLKADVIISMPKPKSHRIAGYTAALKNMIGANARKEYLPHHRKGAKGVNSDEYVGTHRLLKWINSTAKDCMNHAIKMNNQALIRVFNEIGRRTGRRLNKLEPDRVISGMWYGNDTIWRTILDVNHAIMYADKDGIIKDIPQRKIIHIGDMVVCGDHEGPLNPSYKKVGGILFSENAVEFDMVVVKLMGFDWRKLKVLYKAIQDNMINDKDDIRFLQLKCNDIRYDKGIDDILREDFFMFKPTKGWEGHI